MVKIKATNFYLFTLTIAKRCSGNKYFMVWDTKLALKLLHCLATAENLQKMDTTWQMLRLLELSSKDAKF